MKRLEFGLRGVHDLDHLARTTLEHLATLPDVARAGLALAEGAGRRLRFSSSDRLADAELAWCHIDAYDDVPLTTVVRTGGSLLGSLDELGPAYGDFRAHQREVGTDALAVLALPGAPRPIGGIILYFHRVQAFAEDQRAALEAAAHAIAEAVLRITSAGHAADHDPAAYAADDVHRASLELDADPRAASSARRFLRTKLDDWGIDDDITDNAQLCLSELVNNVIMHARTTSRLTVSMEDRQLTVMLRDLGGAGVGGQRQQHQPVIDSDEFRVFGRGLTLVDALTDDWGSHRDEIGTTAWFVFRLDPREEEPARTG